MWSCHKVVWKQFLKIQSCLHNSCWRISWNHGLHIRYINSHLYFIDNLDWREELQFLSKLICIIYKFVTSPLMIKNIKSWKLSFNYFLWKLCCPCDIVDAIMRTYYSTNTENTITSCHYAEWQINPKICNKFRVVFRTHCCE